MSTAINSPTNRDKVLSTIFASKARVAILRLFVLDPTRTYYQRQIERATGLAIRAIQRELERLTDIALLYRRVEGNRRYYKIDMDFTLFPELRVMIMKTATPVERLRGALAVEASVRLVFLDAGAVRVLVVTNDGSVPSVPVPEQLTLEVMSADGFVDTLENKSEDLAPYLSNGVDLLGRREDILWRRIEAAGYTVEKGEGVP